MSHGTGVCGLVALTVLVLAPGARGHELADGLLRAKYKDDRGVLEVEWRLDATEIEQALTRVAGKTIDIDALSAAERDRLLGVYLGPRFAATRGAVRYAWTVAGSQLDGADIFVFLEVPIPGGLDGVTLEATALFDSTHEVRHLLTVVWGTRRWSATLDKANPKIELRV